MRSVGLGWMLETSGDTTVAWHNGGTGGFGTIVAAADRPQRAGAIAIVVNSPHTSALDTLARETLRTALEHSPGQSRMERRYRGY